MRPTYSATFQIQLMIYGPLCGGVITHLNLRLAAMNIHDVLVLGANGRNRFIRGGVFQERFNIFFSFIGCLSKTISIVILFNTSFKKITTNIKQQNNVYKTIKDGENDLRISRTTSLRYIIFCTSTHLSCLLQICCTSVTRGADCLSVSNQLLHLCRISTILLFSMFGMSNESVTDL